MYEVYILKDMEWKYFDSTDNLQKLDIIVYKLTEHKEIIQILQDEKELCCLNGTLYQYWWFKNKFIRNRKLGYDYVKSFKKGSE